MGSRRVFIHDRLANGTILETDVHPLFHFVNGLYDVLTQVLDVDLPLLILFYLSLLLNIVAKQIVDLFIVDLEERATHQKLLVFR